MSVFSTTSNLSLPLRSNANNLYFSSSTNPSPFSSFSLFIPISIKGHQHNHHLFNHITIPLTPTHLAILSQPPDTIHGSLRVTVQGEVIEKSFDEQHLCFRTLQCFTAATLEHGMHPPFVEYFRLATPELEYGRMNIGSRPAKRKPSGGIETLRAIPWIFAWTQTRFHLPVWLGFGAAFKHVIDKDIRNLQMIQEMYNQWPFFRVTIDLVEMVFAKGDPGIAALYDRLLVSDDLWSFGELLRTKFEETKQLLLQVAAHKDLLEGDPYLKQRLRLRDSYITTLNVCQAYTLKRIRDPNYNVKLCPHIHHIPSISLAKLLPAPSPLLMLSTINFLLLRFPATTYNNHRFGFSIASFSIINFRSSEYPLLLHEAIVHLLSTSESFGKSRYHFAFVVCETAMLLGFEL